MDLQKLGSEAAVTPRKRSRGKKKRAVPDSNLESAGDAIDVSKGHVETMDGDHVGYDLSEPTMGEKLESLNLLDNNKVTGLDKQESSPQTKPPSADSVHILLKQALHAEDRALLLDCLYTQDEKVIANSTSMLTPSDVLKLLDSLLSVLQSRGAVLACALPWLRSLLLQHASGIMSQESSLRVLNSLYQLIESRVSTFQSALQLSSSIDFLYTGVVDDEVEENGATTPIIFEDKDESDTEESDDAMDTDGETEEQGVLNLVGDIEEGGELSTDG